MSDSAGQRARFERERRDWPNAEFSRFVAAGTLEWHVQIAGSGEDLLLLHGTGSSTHSWRDVLPILSRAHRVIAVDLPGHGFTSALPRGRATLGGMSGALGALLRALDSRPTHLVGHSAGAAIAVRMALDGLAEPRAIVSVNGAFLPLTGTAALLFAPLARLLAGNAFVRALVARRASERDHVARVLASTGSRLDARGIDLYARLLRAPAHVAGVLDMMAHWDLEVFVHDLPGLSIPLELIVAEGDLTVPPAQAVEVQRRVAHAAVVRVPGLGHLAHEERPALLAATIEDRCRAH